MEAVPQESHVTKTNESRGMRRGRKNVSRACVECRRRRVKCDASTPSCSRCCRRSIECSYSTEEDKRRPAPKSYVDLLRGRIDHLERLLHENSINPNDSPDLVEASPLIVQRPSSSTRQKEDDLPLRGELSKNESMNFDQDGEARYFGPTSGRLEFKSLEQIKPSDDGVAANLHRYCQALMDEDAISQELQDHLIDLFFIWEQPFNQVVDEHMFRQSLERNGKWCNPLLLNSILCLGARHSDRAEVRTDAQDSNTAGRMFLEKASVLLHFDLKSLSLTTIQSVIILTTAYCSFGEDAASWLHHGIATRLALDMGINLDFGVHLQSDTHSSPSGEEIYLRRQIHWALYCMDKLSAMYTGRICTYLDFQSAVELPQNGPHPGNRHSITCRYPQNNQVLCAHITLCQILEAILISLYAPKPVLGRKQRRSFWASYSLKLDNWQYDLPDELLLRRYTTSLPPAIFTIHMVYHTAHIHLNKPFLIKSRNDAGGSTQSQEPTIATARKRSYQAALGVCQVAARYRSTFGSFRRSAITATHCTVSAVLILLNSLATQWDNVDLHRTEKNIDLCLFVLSELGTSWNPARRMQQSVYALNQRIRKQHASPYKFEKSTLVAGAMQGNDTISSEQTELGPATGTPKDGTQDTDYNQYSLDDYLVDPFAEVFSQGQSTDDVLSTGADFSWGLLPDDYGFFGTINRENLQNSWR